MSRFGESMRQGSHETGGQTAAEDRRRGTPHHLAFFMPSLAGGGVERVMLNLAQACVERGHRVDLVVCQVEGPYQHQVPKGVRVIGLTAGPTGWLARAYILAADPQGFIALLRPVLLPVKSWKRFPYLPDLTRYLRHERPRVLLSATTHANLMALWARRLARVPTRVVVSEHITKAQAMQDEPKKRRWHWRFLPPVVRRTYAWADAVVAVSDGVADDLSLITGIPRNCLTTIYNPIVTPELRRQAQVPLDHPWFTPGAPPVVLGAGRLRAQKDFPTLVRAFARARAVRDMRLMILGGGKDERRDTQDKAPLLALADQLGVVDDVALPGFVENPFAYMARASVFVLSSAWEGFGNVIAEALACGCPVVSTDCPSGPAEILENGKYGPLVPVGDDVALADAILSLLRTPPDRDRLRARSAMFAVDYAAEQYLGVLLGSA
jgi:glycosyltransferase involved in cell wall biosynthesis